MSLFVKWQSDEKVLLQMGDKKVIIVCDKLIHTEVSHALEENKGSLPMMEA